uniref:Small ribosomal subunit protein mS25 n=1 Tax=Nothoprocta perdicaria TaxID=30464 RepID=A0A8C6Z9C8_NOTPE
MPMKGRFPVRRTLQYLSQGDIIFKSSVKVMTVNYNTAGELSEGARKFVFFNIPQIQYKNPWVQIMLFRNMTPSPFLRFYLGSAQVSGAGGRGTAGSNNGISHFRETLEKEEKERKKLSHPATFGPKKYHLRECMCEIEGQVPCPAFVPLPKEMRGKYKAAMKNEASA